MSFHHWMYFGCQSSSARWSRLLLERPTLLGIFSAEIMVNPRNSGPLEIELGPRLRAVGSERALVSDGIGPLKNPVLPRGEPSEDLRFHRFRAGKTQVGFHPRQRVG